jgi:hypothetical protein
MVSNMYPFQRKEVVYKVRTCLDWGLDGVGQTIQGIAMDIIEEWPVLVSCLCEDKLERS